MDSVDADDGPPGEDVQLNRLACRYERDGINTRYLEEPFLEASELGDAETLQHRLNGLGADERRRFVRNVDQQGRSGLILAASKGDAALVGVLLDAGANPKDADSSGASALHYAAGRGATTIVATLLGACAEASQRDDRGEEPLMWASSAACADALLQARADASARSTDQRTALMFAAARGNLDVIEVLACQPSVDLEANDRQGRSAWAWADAGKSPEASALLASLGARAPAASAAAHEAPRTFPEALHEAARRGDAASCSKLLRKEGAAADADVEVCGETALLLACACPGEGALATAQVLLEAKADPSAADKYTGETPLLRALLGGGGDELVWLLLEARADPTRRDHTGRAPAEVAASWGRELAADILRAALAGELPLPPAAAADGDDAGESTRAE